MKIEIIEQEPEKTTLSTAAIFKKRLHNLSLTSAFSSRALRNSLKRKRLVFVYHYSELQAFHYAP